jgi:serine/threonine protein kinase
MSRVVSALDDDPTGTGLPVQYIIFECAESDVREQALIDGRFDTAWALRTLHQVAVGVRQLHGRNIVHQDLKPSNVLLFETVGSKVGDLGSSTNKENSSPRDQFDVAGDRTYAPPDLLYGYNTFLKAHLAVAYPRL